LVAKGKKSVLLNRNRAGDLSINNFYQLQSNVIANYTMRSLNCCNLMWISPLKKEKRHGYDSRQCRWVVCQVVDSVCSVAVELVFPRSVLGTQRGIVRQRGSGQAEVLKCRCHGFQAAAWMRASVSLCFLASW
jgi:hypothetical protein